MYIGGRDYAGVSGRPSEDCALMVNRSYHAYISFVNWILSVIQFISGGHNMQDTQVREVWLSSEDTGAYGRDIGTGSPLHL